jgi:hypothetical protein
MKTSHDKNKINQFKYTGLTMQNICKGILHREEEERQSREE